MVKIIGTAEFNVFLAFMELDQVSLNKQLDQPGTGADVEGRQ